jgi:hypothetical protein
LLERTDEAFKTATNQSLPRLWHASTHNLIVCTALLLCDVVVVDEIVVGVRRNSTGNTLTKLGGFGGGLPLPRARRRRFCTTFLMKFVYNFASTICTVVWTARLAPALRVCTGHRQKHGCWEKTFDNESISSSAREMCTAVNRTVWDFGFVSSASMLRVCTPSGNFLIRARPGRHHFFVLRAHAASPESVLDSLLRSIVCSATWTLI